MTAAPTRLSAAEWCAATTVVVMWGLNFIAVKTAVAVLPPLFLTGLRFMAVGLALAPFFPAARTRLRPIAAIAVVLGIGHFGLLFVGLSGMDAASAAIVVQLGVPFSVLLSWAVFGDRPDRVRLMGMSLAFVGVAILAGEPSLPSPLPLLLVVVAMLAWAVSNVQVKSLAAIPPLALNGWMALLAGPMLLGLSALFETGQVQALERADATIWGAVAFTVIGSTLVAYTLWYRLLARHPMSRIVPFTMVSPVIAALGGVLALGEPLSWQKLAGGALTLAGVAAVQLITPKPLP